MKPFAPLNAPLLLALLLQGSLEAQERAPSIRAILGDAELVLRGTALDQERAPGGLWHRFRVLEVLWPPAEEGAKDLGPTLRVFAHGAGMPEGAELPLNEELLIGVTRLPTASTEGLPAFLKTLGESFRPDRPDERPALVAPDGIFPLGGDPGTAAEAARFVRGLRDPSTDSRERRELLLEMAGHRSPAFREEALRRLSLPEAALDGGAVGRILERLRSEIAGEAHPAVLSAHLDLLEGLDLGGAGSILASLLRAAPREQIALRAGALLAERGSPEDLRSLSREFSSAGPRFKARILRTLSLAGGAEHLPVFASALKDPDPAVRAAGLAALEGHPAPEAAGLIDAMKEDPEPALRQAARGALERRSREAEPASGADPGSLGEILKTARARVLLEERRPGRGPLR